MSSYALLFDRSGKLLDEINGTFSRSWKLSASDQCKFAFPVSSPKCTRRNFEAGNYNEDGLTAWGGRMDMPRGWQSGEIKITAYSGEDQFAQRAGVPFVYPYVVKATAGVIFQELVRVANLEEDTLLRPGEIYMGGATTALEISPATLLSIGITRLLKRTGMDYSVEPVVLGNQLTFQANWYERRGSLVGAGFNDRNSELVEDGLEEQGPIINRVFAYSDGESNGERKYYLAEDKESRAQFGLHHKPLPVSTDGEGAEAVVKWAAEAEVKRLAWPRKVYKGTAKRTDNFFSTLDIGNIYPYENAEAGFGDGEEIGTETHVRLKGMAYTDGDDNASVVLTEEIL